MKKKLPIRCKIKEDLVKDGITWLEIDESDGGYYLFQYVDIILPPKWDVFSDNIEDLLEDCRRIWKIGDNDWSSVERVES